MKKGIVFTLITLSMLLSLLFVFQNVSLKIFNQYVNSATSNSLNYLFDDISDSFMDFFNISVKRNLSSSYFYGRFPSQTNVSAFESFLRRYYMKSNFHLDFLSLSGDKISLKQIEPSIYFHPKNIKLQFDSLNKNKLFLYSPEQPFLLKFLAINLTLINASLGSNIGWLSYHPCNSSTIRCLPVNITLMDSTKNWTLVDNLDLDHVSELNINCTNSFARILIGSPLQTKKVMEINPANNVFDFAINVGLNTTEFRLVFGAKMFISESANLSRTDFLIAEGS